MKIQKKTIAIIAIAILLLVAYNLKPRSFEGKRQVAFIEFKHYIDMKNMKITFFTGPYLDLTNENYTEFYWRLTTQKGDGGKVCILVPEFPLSEIVTTFVGDTSAWKEVFNTDPKN
jgi:hypothetical protein